MNSDSRWYRASKSKVVCIRRADHNASQWEIWLNGRLLCGGFGSAEEAALAANTKNFDSDDIKQIFGGTYVPSDINMWQTSPPNDFPSMPENEGDNETTACRSRFRKSSSTRLDYD
jgi:hypothetical protein